MPRIPDETIQQILDASDIVDVISGYLPNLKRAGSTFKANCPFHNERTPSFNVNPARQMFKCFGCGEGGSAIGFVMKYQNVPFVEAVEILAARANITIVKEAPDPQAEARRKSRSRLVKLNNETARFLHQQLLTNPDAAHARSYLKSRGYGKKMAENWLVGWMPDNTRLYADWVKTQNFTGRELIGAGLANFKVDGNPRAGLYIRFKGRLMFPIENDYGDIVGFSGRKLHEEAPGGKYINSPETALFDKSRTIFGLSKARRHIGKEGFALLCEGQIDAIACHEAGLQCAIAPLGTAFTPQQANLLKRYTNHITLCFDADAAGQKASTRAFMELSTLGLQVRIVSMPDGSDPDDYISANGIEDFRQRIDKALPFFDHLVKVRKKTVDLSRPDLLADFTQELAPMITAIPDQISREANIDHLSRLLGLSPASLIEATQQAAAKNNYRPRSYDLKQKDSSSSTAEPTTIHPHIKQLCRLCLSSAEALEWLNEQLGSLLETSSDLPGFPLLKTLLSKSTDPDNPSAINTLLEKLPEGDQKSLRPLLELSRYDAPLSAAEETMATLSRNHLKKQLEIKLNALSDPALAPEEQANLQKEILDLQSILKDIHA